MRTLAREKIPSERAKWLKPWLYDESIEVKQGEANLILEWLSKKEEEISHLIASKRYHRALHELSIALFHIQENMGNSDDSEPELYADIRSGMKVEKSRIEARIKNSEPGYEKVISQIRDESQHESNPLWKSPFLLALPIAMALGVFSGLLYGNIIFYPYFILLPIVLAVIPAWFYGDWRFGLLPILSNFFAALFILPTTSSFYAFLPSWYAYGLFIIGIVVSFDNSRTNSLSDSDSIGRLNRHSDYVAIILAGFGGVLYLIYENFIVALIAVIFLPAYPVLIHSGKRKESVFILFVITILDSTLFYIYGTSHISPFSGGQFIFAPLGIGLYFFGLSFVIWKIAVFDKYAQHMGTLSGLALAISLLGILVTSQPDYASPIYPYLFPAILVLSVLLLIYTIRRRHARLTYISGLIILLCASSLFVLFVNIFVRYISPNLGVLFLAVSFSALATSIASGVALLGNWRHIMYVSEHLFTILKDTRKNIEDLWHRANRIERMRITSIERFLRKIIHDANLALELLEKAKETLNAYRDEPIRSSNRWRQEICALKMDIARIVEFAKDQYEKTILILDDLERASANLIEESSNQRNISLAEPSLEKRSKTIEERMQKFNQVLMHANLSANQAPQFAQNAYHSARFAIHEIERTRNQLNIRASELLALISSPDFLQRNTSVRYTILTEESEKLRNILESYGIEDAPPEKVGKALENADKMLRDLERILEQVDTEPMHTEPLDEMPENSISSVEEKGIKVTRGCQPIGGKIIYKVKIHNIAKYVITDASVAIVSYPTNCLELEGERFRTVAKIEPDGFRSLKFEFHPTQDCVEGNILSNASYVDYTGSMHTTSVKTQTIRSVCDMLIPTNIAVEKFLPLLSGMKNSEDERKVGLNPQVLFKTLENLLPQKNFEIISIEPIPGGTQFIGSIKALAEGKYTKKKVAIEITVMGASDGAFSTVCIKASSDAEDMLAITLHELTDEVRNLRLSIDYLMEGTRSLMKAAGESLANQQAIMDYLKRLEKKTDENSMLAKDILAFIQTKQESLTSDNVEEVIAELMKHIDSRADEHKVEKSLTQRIKDGIRRAASGATQMGASSILWNAAKVALVMLTGMPIQ